MFSEGGFHGKIDFMNDKQKDNAVYILDSYGLIYRAYFALINHPMTNSAGDNISAVMIFFRNLKSLLSKHNPAYLAAAFDSKGKTFRHERYTEYKANRMKTPEDLHAQIPWIEEILEALKIPVLRSEGFEADDIIATVARKCKEEGKECRILSGDKDLLQLVNESCKEMQPDKTNGGWETTGIEEVTAKWGIGPEKILDYLSLVGDSADNVPGVKGVGDKTALKLLGEYGTLDGIYEHAAEIKGALGEKIRGDKENAYLSKELITLREDVPVEINFEDFTTDNLDYGAAAQKLKFYGALQVAKSYASEAAGSSDEINDKVSSINNADTEEVPLEIKKNSGSYRPVTELADLTAIVDEILSGAEKAFAFDTETDSLNSHSANLVGFSICSQTGKAVYVPVVLPGGMFAQPCIEKSKCIEQLERLLMNPQVKLIMHNGKFDLEVLLANGLSKLPECQILDTMIAAWLLNPDANGKSPYSLEYLGETKLGLKGIEFNDVVPKGKTFADVELEQAYPYGAEDADFTWQLWQLFEKKLETDQKFKELFYQMEMPLLPILTGMEKEGIHLDKNALAEFSKELEKEISQAEQEIYSFAGHEFNIASTKQLQTVLFEEQHLEPGKKTKTGYSTDTAVLEELCDRTENPLPKKILNYRSFTKLQSTYVETLPLLADNNGRIHTSFMQSGTATGRLSSHDPNLQNIPVRDENGRRIRSAFTAEEGTVLISADYAQIELVVLAHLSGDKNLCQSFIDGTDVHRSTAALIYGIKPEEVSPDQRRFAKTVNFGVMYGMSAFRLAKELNISRTQAKEFIDQYFTTYSDVKRFIAKTILDARSNGYVETILGRRRKVPQLASKNKLEQQAGERIAINTPIQGTAADIVKTAMIKVNKALKESGSKAKMLLQVHDELIFKCPDDEQTIKETIALITKEMEGAMKLSIPLRVSVEYGKNWGEFH